MANSSTYNSLNVNVCLLLITMVMKFTCFATTSSNLKKDNGERYWSYSTNSSVGPPNWGKTYKQCSDGKRQSPINIESANVRHDSALSPLYLYKYSQSFQMRASYKIENNGETVAMTIRPTLRAMLQIGMRFQKQNFVFHEIRFRWGLTSDEGSEHKIDGESYAMEMQIVHFNSK